ncbi:hypothetical protein EON65_35025 [archaeon]|nr:MAG: hypothetical protein EON65_35025 [archaeon]
MMDDRTNVFEPPKSYPRKFRVAIQQPEAWKIEAIADFKRRKYLASKGISNNNSSTSSSLSNNEPRRLKRSNSITNPSQMDTPKVTGKVDLTAAQRDIAIMQTIRELEIYDHNSKIMQGRIAHMHTVKSSLLWMLKKITMHERMQAHEGRYLPVPANP